MRRFLITRINPQLNLVNSFSATKSAGSSYDYNLQGQRAEFRDLKSNAIMSGVFRLPGSGNASKNQTAKIKLR